MLVSKNKFIDDTIKNKDRKISVFKFYKIFFLLGILSASSIKQVGSFYLDNERSYSFLTSIFSQNSTLILMVSLVGLFFTLLLEFKRRKSIPTFTPILKLYLFLKIWLITVMIFYNALDLDSVLSVLLIIMISISILWLDPNKQEAFYTLGKVVGIYACFFVFINFYEIFVNSGSVFWNGRLFGTTNHPNFLGGYAAAMIPFILMLIVSTYGYKKFALGFVLVLMIGLVLLSGSRASVLSLSIGLVFWIYMYWGWKKIWYLLFIVITLFILVSSFDVVNTFSNSDYDFSRLSSTMNNRQDVVASLFDVFYNHYLVGNPTLAGQTSNSYLAFLARGGLVAGIILLLLLVTLIYSLTKQPKKRLLSATYTSAVMIIIVDSIFEGVLVESFSLGQLIFVFSIMYVGEKRINVR